MDSFIPIGRFAPTPSGGLHLGNVFSLLLAWLGAKSAGGRVILRMEDLDPLRTSMACADQIMRDLAWLGLEWDQGPRPQRHDPFYFQSRRGEFYAECLDALEALGLLYPCFCSRAELHAASAPHQSDGAYVYAGRCRRLSPEEAQKKAAHRPGAVRVCVPPLDVAFTDGIQGPYTQNLAAHCGDYILRRSDGVFAYQLAAPADDGAMGVTQVVRGRDLLASTPRQIWLLSLLGYAPPRYYHHPLLLAPDGRRLAKRDGDMDMARLRARHARPEKIIGTLAHLGGLVDRPEPLPAADLLPLFRWEALPREDICLSERDWARLVGD